MIMIAVWAESRIYFKIWGKVTKSLEKGELTLHRKLTLVQADKSEKHLEEEEEEEESYTLLKDEITNDFRNHLSILIIDNIFLHVLMKKLVWYTVRPEFTKEV